MNTTIGLAILGLHIPASIGMFFVFPTAKAAMIAILSGTLFLQVESYFKIPVSCGTAGVAAWWAPTAGAAPRSEAREQGEDVHLDRVGVVAA